MKKTGILVAAATVAAATLAMAHQGVTDPDVKARMDAMTAVGQATKTLGDMAKGAAPLHQAKARMARDTLVTTATRIPALFAAPAMDDKSEAAPEIWQNKKDFTKKARAMQDAASDMEFATRAELQESMKRLGATCASCHKAYRIKN
ncbi:c-type cytochrome [Shimia biformata]|uniref:c-type cytochrome n=1 Tax=Shimia biformata TaxID=1294299 RepID=UPI001950352D|nr:cytochrome c [Shimia biformata]